ncbi:MerR family transcriptional regulator [Alkalihalobacillus hwajinpoensis]|uniref:MerR family transcriptional regulator n=1 Tax=Guptibacillus hwajinpoensis TaxID=208199 RepID=UPI001883CB97|nr:MerR family transcriptional regulator [Pseudalkalibacillus hwajinpoensis]MBF0707951.1 MerR family transcriptional regulator [Pseudalkalibacillus hwajinpoensis]
MMKRVKEVAELTGISVRTLHYYDEIGLLTPATTETGYRLYSKDDLEKLQQILFFRALDFSLKKIKTILEEPDFDRMEALNYQKEILHEKKQRLDKMITMIDKTIQNVKGERSMTDQERFAGFDFSQNPYEQEARERYGDEAINRSKQKINSLSKDEKNKLGHSFDSIYKRLADLRNGSPEAAEAQKAIHDWYEFLNGKVGYHYTLEAFEGLGQVYVDDERFTKNIDQYGEGLALFMRDAMKVYADRNK